MAASIPELAKADPASFGIVVATVDGRIYETRRDAPAVTIQSISKPLAYGVARRGTWPRARPANHRRRAERRRLQLDQPRARHRAADEPDDQRRRHRHRVAGVRRHRRRRGCRASSARCRPLPGGRSAIDEAVYESERATGHRNRAIGHMLQLRHRPRRPRGGAGAVLQAVLDPRRLPRPGADRRDAGQRRRQPGDARARGARRVHQPDPLGDDDLRHVRLRRRVGLLVGMHAGQERVGGGIIAVLPGQLASASSPPLDERGNSVRGVQVCEAISRELGCTSAAAAPSASTVRALASLASAAFRMAPSGEREPVLEEHGPARGGRRAPGDPGFATLEPVLREIVDADDELHSRGARLQARHPCRPRRDRMLASLVHCSARARPAHRAHAGGGRAAVGVQQRARPEGRARGELPAAARPGARMVRARPARALRRRQRGGAIGGLAQHRLCIGASADDIAALEARVERRSFEAGQTILRRSDAADALYFLMRGEVSVIVAPGGGHKRLSTLGRHGFLASRRSSPAGRARPTCAPTPRSSAP